MANILIIDDERQIRESIQQMLDKAHHHTYIAESGDDGIVLFKKHNIDLVITDILMPNKDGYDTIKELHTLKPNLPIIAISGGAPVLKKEFGLEAALIYGAATILSKPFTRAELMEAIATTLNTPT